MRLHTAHSTLKCVTLLFSSFFPGRMEKKSTTDSSISLIMQAGDQVKFRLMAGQRETPKRTSEANEIKLHLLWCIFLGIPQKIGIRQERMLRSRTECPSFRSYMDVNMVTNVLTIYYFAIMTLKYERSAPIDFYLIVEMLTTFMVFNAQSHTVSSKFNSLQTIHCTQVDTKVQINSMGVESSLSGSRKQ